MLDKDKQVKDLFFFCLVCLFEPIQCLFVGGFVFEFMRHYLTGPLFAPKARKENLKSF